MKTVNGHAIHPKSKSLDDSNTNTQWICALCSTVKDAPILFRSQPCQGGTP